MPQSKTAKRTSSARSSGSGAKKTRSSGSKASSNGRTATKTRSTAKKRTPPPKSRAAKLADKAKVPALTGGAMLVGLAGGVTAARKGKRRRGGLLGRKSLIPTPKLNLPTPTLKKLPVPKKRGSTVKWVEEKAKEVGDAGYRVAELTSEVEKVQKSFTHGSR
jgi:hypothetical protein